MTGRALSAKLSWLVLVALTSWSLAFGAALVPSTFKGVKVSVIVARDDRTSIFGYHYRVENPSVNDAIVWSMSVDITKGPGQAELSKDGLTSGPGYMRHTSEAASQEVPMTPVGLDGPAGWIVGLAVRETTPRLGLAYWAGTDTAELIRPGASASGFRLSSRGLPSIRTVIIEPDIDYQNLPPEFADPQKARQLRESLLFATRTVAPKAPPDVFVASEFLNYLITLTNESRRQGWIRTDGVHQSLVAKLRNAKRELENRRVVPARQLIEAFAQEVRGTACTAFDCPGARPLTSEAFALLFYNAEFLLTRLR